MSGMFGKMCKNHIASGCPGHASDPLREGYCAICSTPSEERDRETLREAEAIAYTRAYETRNEPSPKDG